MTVGTFFALLASAAIAHVVRAQTAVSLFPVGFQGLPLSGEIQGTGTDGTTFVLSGTTLGQPVTVTLVQGSTQISEAAAFSAPGVTVSVSAGCSIDAALGVADCTAIQVAGGVAMSTSQIVSFLPTAITVSTSGVAASTTSSASETTSTSTTSTTSVFVPPTESIETPGPTPSAPVTVTAPPSQSSSSAREYVEVRSDFRVFMTILSSAVVCLIGGWLM